MNQSPYLAPPIYNYYYGPHDQPAAQAQSQHPSIESVNKVLDVIDCYILGIFIFQLIIALLLAAIAIWLGLDPLHKFQCNCQCETIKEKILNK